MTNSVAARKRKTAIPARRVLADDLAITVDGEEYFIHEGDWVEFVGGNLSLGDFLSTIDLMTTDLKSINVSEEGRNTTRGIGERFSEMIVGLLDRIVEWHWKDKRGNLLAPQPTEKILRSLESEEIFWLLSGGVQQEAPLVSE